MKQPLLVLVVLVFAVAMMAGCGANASPNPAAEAPPPTQVEHASSANVISTPSAERFALTTAEHFELQPELKVNGVVAPDVSRTVPVVSLAPGRAVAVYARLGDSVRRGQVLMRIQSPDLAGAFAEYRRAQADSQLAQTQLSRANELSARGAIATKELELAQDTATKAGVDVEATTQKLHILGVDPTKPTEFLDIAAPVSGVITEQNITAAAGVKTLDNSPNLFTIADLSRVWVLCDVYENDLRSVRVGDTARIRLNAYPDRTFTGRVGEISPVLDPNTRAAKVRIEVANPGLMRVGMFVEATFHEAQNVAAAVVPASAVLHLHDSDWVYVPDGKDRFRRVPVKAGEELEGKRQVLRSGLAPGQTVVRDALVLENSGEQE